MAMTLDDLLDVAGVHAAGELIGRPGAQLVPMVLVQFKTRPPAIMQLPWRDDREKIVMLAAVRAAMREFRGDVVNYSIVSEAWVITQDHAPRPGDLAPADSDKRREMVFAVAADRQDTRLRGWEIVRGPDAVVANLVEDKAGPPEHMEGRMGELLS
jgi:hypothetical protein